MFDLWPDVLLPAAGLFGLRLPRRATTRAGMPQAAARHRRAVRRREALAEERAAAAAAAFVPRPLAPLAAIAARLQERLDRRRRARFGRAGEDLVARTLAGSLGPGWTVVRNAVLRSGRASRELDLVLVGPAGVVAVEVKFWPRTVALTDRGAFVARRGVWESRPDPVRQARDQAAVLQDWLRRQGFAVPAAAALLFPNTTSLTAPAAAPEGAPFLSWGPEAARNLARTLRAVPRERIDAATCEAIVAALTR